MMTTMGCMSKVLTRVMFMGMLGLGGFGATLSVLPAVFAAGTETNAAATKETVPHATYDETQPGADDPRVKEGFAAYQAGDFKKAYDIWLPLAETGNAEAQFRIAGLRMFGRGVDKDYQLAIIWLHHSSEQDHVRSFTNLGYLHDQGLGTPINRVKARIFYELAAKNCEITAMYNLGTLIMRLNKSERDNIEGHMWLQIASVLGDKDAEKVSKKLIGLISTPLDFRHGNEKAQEWLLNHSCK